MEYFETKELEERAILAGVHTGNIDPLSDSTEESLAELARLADTAGAQVVGTMLQNRPSVDNALYLGEGKLEELRLACEGQDANLVIFDDELSPIQLRNIERTLGIKVIDRSMLILDIFARHAVTREGKIIYGNSNNGNGDGGVTTGGGNVPTVGGGNDLFITSINGGINIAVAAPQNICVVNATGHILYNGYVTTNTNVLLPMNGIYVVKGQNEVQKIFF